MTASRAHVNHNKYSDLTPRRREVRPLSLTSLGPDVLARASGEERLLITFDKDFGELAFRRGAKASQGVVLFRIAQPSAQAVAERVASVLASRDDWPGHFSVVDDSTVRIRPLPQS